MKPSTRDEIERLRLENRELETRLFMVREQLRHANDALVHAAICFSDQLPGLGRYRELRTCIRASEPSHIHEIFSPEQRDTDIWESHDGDEDCSIRRPGQDSSCVGDEVSCSQIFGRHHGRGIDRSQSSRTDKHNLAGENTPNTGYGCVNHQSMALRPPDILDQRARLQSQISNLGEASCVTDDGKTPSIFIVGNKANPKTRKATIDTSPRLSALDPQADDGEPSTDLLQISKVRTAARSLSASRRMSNIWYPFDEASIVSSQGDVRSSIPHGGHGYDRLRKDACFIEDMSEREKSLYWLQLEHEIYPHLSAREWASYYDYAVLPKHKSHMKEIYGSQKITDLKSVLHQSDDQNETKLGITVSSSAAKPVVIRSFEAPPLSTINILGGPSQVPGVSRLRDGYAKRAASPNELDHSKGKRAQVFSRNSTRSVLSAGNDHNKPVGSGESGSEFRVRNESPIRSRKQGQSTSRASTTDGFTVADRTPGKKRRGRPPRHIRIAQSKLADAARNGTSPATVAANPVKPSSSTLISIEPITGPPDSAHPPVSPSNLTEPALVHSKPENVMDDPHDSFASPGWTAMINNIPTNITIAEVLDKIHGAKIMFAYLVKLAKMRTKPQSTTNSAIVTFSEAKEMQSFCNEQIHNPITFEGKNAVYTTNISVVRGETAEAKAPWYFRRSLDPSASRVIFIDDANKTSTPESVMKTLRRRQSIGTALRITTSQDGRMVFAFSTAGTARTVHELIMGEEYDPGFSHRKVNSRSGENNKMQNNQSNGKVGTKVIETRFPILEVDICRIRAPVFLRILASI